MRIYALVKRNFKEIVRDPLTLVFAIILPIFLLFIFQQFDIPSEVYNIENFAPSIIIFGYSFITLFTATLIAKDRASSLLSRLFASSLRSRDYILGYILALLPVALIQSILFFITALLLGLPFSINILITILIMLPISILFIAFGILIGSLVNDKAAPGIGSIIVQLVCFTSGMYFSIDQIGGFLKVLARILPFSYAVDIAKNSLAGSLETTILAIIITSIYTLIIFILSSIVFKSKMISDNK